MKCVVGCHIKAFSFLFCTVSEVKSTKGGEHEYTEWLQNNEQKKETYLVCLHAVTKYEKVESINTQNDYKTTSKKWTDKRTTNSFCVVCKSLNPKKTNSRSSTIVMIVKKISWKTHLSQWSSHDKCGWSKAEDW